MILNDMRDQTKITMQNVKNHPKCLKTMSQFQSIKVVFQSQQNQDIQIEKLREQSLSNQSQRSLISYRFNRKQMKPETFVNILNGLEVLSENKHFMKMLYFHFSKDSDYVFILFQDFGQSFQELLQKGDFSIGEKQAKTSFTDIAKSLLLVEQSSANTVGLSQDFILLPLNIYIDFQNDTQRARAKIIPFDFFEFKNKLDINDLPKNIILSPELLNVLHSQTSEQPLDIQLKKSNSYILGKKILGQSEREREFGLNPQTSKEGPNDEFIKDNLEKLIVKGKKNGLILILEQCLHYNINERIGYADLHQMCKNPILFLKHKQVIGQLKTSQKLFSQQTKSYQAAFKNVLEEIQIVLQESNGDIQFINQNFNNIKQEFETLDLPSFSDIDEVSSLFKKNKQSQKLDQKKFDSEDGIGLTNYNENKSLYIVDKNNKIENGYDRDDINSFVPNRLKEDQGKSRVQDQTTTDKSDSKQTSVVNIKYYKYNQFENDIYQIIIKIKQIKVRRIRNQDFYNPYGLNSNNHRVVDFNSEKDSKALLNKQQSIIDGEIVGIYSVLAINDYLIASGGDDASIKIWNMDDTKKECIQVLIGHSNSVHSLCLLQQSKVIASGSSGENASIKIWNISDGACIKTLKGHTDTISSICQISNDLIASGSYDSTIKIWRWGSAKCEKTLRQHNFAVLTVCTIDENTIASGSDDCSIMIWDIKKGTMKLDIQGHNSWVQHLIFLKKYNQIASCGGDGTVRIWNRNGQQEHAFQEHDEQVNCLLYLEDKDILISGGSDQKINAYKLSSKKLIQKVENAHKDSILSLTSLSNTLVTSGIDNTITTWKIAHKNEKNNNAQQTSEKSNKTNDVLQLPYNRHNIQESIITDERMVNSHNQNQNDGQVKIEIKN